ncbi:MAG: tripartite tricarboxylate transporter permease [Synergistetes bacterium]|nr:tripartite tricarboxylate transporter permease [Synergistota bacterium]MDW8192583.1 tripartite tricarboxylate transporter permease [Synergistota bacterium]
MELLGAFYKVMLDPISWFLMVIGVAAGTLFGALPGISTSMGVALMLPFTYKLDVVYALILLVSTYCGGVFGGSITAIMFNIPGTPEATPTTFDGYKMTLKGEGGKALGTAIACSAFGGAFSVVMMALISPLLVKAALSFSPADYAAVAFLGLSAVAGLGYGPKEQLKALLSVTLGLLLATVGIDAITGVPRFTFGSSALLGGIKFIPVMIGAFAGGEVLRQIEDRKKGLGEEIVLYKKEITAKIPSLREFLAIKWTILKSAFIGLGIGILPGAGATIAAFVSYGVAKRSSKHGDKFGTGIMEGVAAPETANNASTGGAMVPLLSLGIPGSGTTAVILGVFLMYGIQPGPLLYAKDPQLVYSIIIGMFLANVLMLFIGKLGVKLFVQTLRLPYYVIGTSILLLSLIGSYGLDNDIDDVWVCLVFMVIGYFMRKYGFPVAALVLGLVLGKLIENNLRRALIISGFSWSAALGRPLTISLVAITIFMLVWPYIKAFREKVKGV